MTGDSAVAGALVSVIVPVFDQAAFLPRALGSLRAQDDVEYELIVVDDGSADRPHEVIGDDARIIRHERNRGLGAACNTGLDAARGDIVAYLPADDVWFAGHLAALVRALDDEPRAVLAHSDLATVDDSAAAPQLQLVQVAHRRTPARWRERAEVETDDLELLFWQRLRAGGPVVRTGLASCAWLRHPGQRSRAIAGGLNVFRRRYAAAGPLRFAPRVAATTPAVDEVELYRDLPAPDAPSAADGLHVLLVGELAYNPDRIAVLAERGVRLSGLWIDDPLGFMSVGPLPFGPVRDLPRTGWRAALAADPPDVAYCLLNWRSIDLALAVADALPRLPLVWHFKEAPQRCLARGDWPALTRLYERADHVLFASAEERDWLELALPGRRDSAATSVMDGDLPRRHWFAGDPAKRLGDGRAVHTVCLGRPLGLTADVLRRLAAANVHVHVHGATSGADATAPVDRWAREALDAAPTHVHLYPAVGPPSWRPSLSRYDAGWLHAGGGSGSGNGGDLRRATWDDLNVPARLPTLAAAGLPVILPAQAGPAGSVRAVNRIVGQLGAGLPFTSVDEAVERLRSPEDMATARAGMEAGRMSFTFEAVADELLAVLRQAAGRAGR